MTPEDLAQIREIIKEAVKEAFDPIYERLDNMEKQLVELQHVQRVEAAKAANSRAGFHDSLQPVCLPDGTMPTIFPRSMGALAVGGSELAAGTSKVPSWSREDSSNCIRQYEPNYTSEVEESGDVDEEERARSSRRRRRHLAKLIGVTPTQMAMAAQMASYMP